MNSIQLQSVSKTFELGFKKRHGLLARIIGGLSNREQKKEIIVLDTISLTIKSGEMVGIIGNNGSGKSTLLRIIAGIYRPNSGNIITQGKIISIINLGSGLKERLTMKENIFLVGSLFGISQKTIRENLNSIVHFSGLEQFIDTKIYQFSAGMLQRLAFSIAIHSNPSILLLDEVFEVGDENFRKKSTEKIHELVKAGVSVVFVTHELDMIREHCDRVIWLSNGKICMQGDPEVVVKKYLE